MFLRSSRKVHWRPLFTLLAALSITAGVLVVEAYNTCSKFFPAQKHEIPQFGWRGNSMVFTHIETIYLGVDQTCYDGLRRMQWLGYLGVWMGILLTGFSLPIYI